MTDSMEVSQLTDASAGGENNNGDTAASAPEVELHPAMEKFEQLVEAHKAISEQAKAMDSVIKSLRKDLKKVCKKRRKASGTPSNLMKPISLSDELCRFLGKDTGSKMTRGQVTSLVNEYAKDKELKNPDNRRIIILDQPLAALLGLSQGEEVQIFRVPTHLKTQGHYVKEEAAA